MPRDARKHQKALMKKRSKQKAAGQRKSHQQAFASLSSQAIIRRARTFPLLECWISGTWQGDDLGLVEILLARQQPDGDICYGVYLVDKFCLGLKNTFANAGFSPTRYQNEVRDMIFPEIEPLECPIELAHQMIYASIEYAAQFGFEPDKDFALTQYMLAPRGELEEPYQLTFGQNGKPFFVAGPRDNAARIIKQLEKTAGPGKFDYLAMLDVL
ncbi:MAG: hypothetical protein M3Y76_01175 [Chloroflexota bacterium]|nr:hypothetical protein [Chloroflexota bacterium]